MDECFDVSCSLEARWLIRRTDLDGQLFSRRDQRVHWKACGRHLPSFIRQCTRKGLFEAQVSVLPEAVDG